MYNNFRCLCNLVQKSEHYKTIHLFNHKDNEINVCLNSSKSVQLSTSFVQKVF